MGFILERKRFFVDLFAGCGGLSLGLEQAGFTPVFVNELNKDAMDTYLENRLSDHPWLEKNHVHDVKELVLNPDILDNLRSDIQNQFGVKEIDLLVGGPPCQGFSGIGYRRSYSVDKKQLPSNHLYEDMAYTIHKLKPKIFLFENVRGLLSAKWTKSGEKGEIWNDVLSKFKALDDYHINWSLVHAKEYGVPQNRPRVLLVGIRKDLGYEPISSRAGGHLPDPIFGYPSIQEILGDLVDVSYKNTYETAKYPSPAKSNWQRYFRTSPKSHSISRKGSKLTDHEYSRHSANIEQKFAHMIKNNGQIPSSMKTKKFAQKVLPKQWGEGGPSITATSMPDDYVHYSQPRVLTVREWARLQTFPDWYTFCGKRTTGGIRRAGNPREGLHEREVPKYTQIGNAVPVKMAAEVGKHFAKILDQASRK